ncbi:HNH endonuclease [Pseudoalteromonas obscura]|uniref:HNH endonuclease n=1 Tax=Pseudoalteromonas obscura TaxID=3048491 RepID=A0ABT7EK30_9GAMM|nr:HNH endonuclease [Pseudoalteromonas sp. P94(2023)]MDK2595407.1 HNH endonuclease [Pseudoalteromonas sp. P94(2023)]
MFNVKKSDKIPPSLAEKKSWSGEDVWDALVEDFHGKCYLCEEKNPLDINVEHFHPQGEYEEKAYEWNNLYMSCSRCNNIKLSKYNDLLDCCDNDVDVFKMVYIGVPVTQYSNRVEVKTDSDDPKAKTTVDLLDRIYNSNHSINKKITGAFLRKKIHLQYTKLLNWMTIYFDEESTQSERNNALAKIGVLIEKKQPFSAAMRWCVLEDEVLNPLFKDRMD